MPCSRVLKYCTTWMITDLHDHYKTGRAALEICSRLGVSSAAQKTDGPATLLTFLGIELGTVA